MGAKLGKLLSPRSGDHCSQGIIVWFPRLVAKDSGLSSYKSELWVVGWLPGLAATDCESEFYFSIGSSERLYFSVFQELWKENGKTVHKWEWHEQRLFFTKRRKEPDQHS